MIEALGPRVHLFVHPSKREAFISLFRDTLTCQVLERDFGLKHPIVLVAFVNGSAFSVEFSELAPSEPEPPLSDSRALRGAWIEFAARDVAAVHARLDAAGVPTFSHAGSPERYFCAPGGQVFRIVGV